MKRLITWGLVALSIVAAGCADERGVEPPQEPAQSMSRAEQDEAHAAWRVDMIVTSDSSNDMLAEYSYDEDNRLIKRNISNQNKGNRIVDTRYEESFEWENGLMARQLTYSRYQDYDFGQDYENNFETLYAYDAEGRLLPDGADDNRPGERQYEYDEAGRLVQTYSYEFGEMVYRDRLEWDDNGNVTKYILARPESTMTETPIPGTYRETVFEFEYDDHPKPNFGLGTAFFWDGRFNPWPLAGNALEQLPRTLSRNNLTFCEKSGVAYRYTYNDNGLPATVQTLWIGIDTVEPMIQTIVYKKIGD